MLVLSTYDVATLAVADRRRLRKVALICQDYGQRVQKSVFECQVGRKEWVTLKDRLLSVYDDAKDSLRFYFWTRPRRNASSITAVINRWISP